MKIIIITIIIIIIIIAAITIKIEIYTEIIRTRRIMAENNVLQYV